MAQIELYIIESSGEVVTKECCNSVVMLTKVLYRLNIIDGEQALKIVAKFRILFV